MNFSVPGKKSDTQKDWNKQKAKDRLEVVANTDKKSGWIRGNLKVKSSSWIGRLFWSIIGKRIGWMRKFFYGVDMNRSEQILKTLKPKIADSNDQQLIDLFNKAAENFNNITQHYHHVSSISSVFPPLQKPDPVKQEPVASASRKKYNQFIKANSVKLAEEGQKAVISTELVDLSTMSLMALSQQPNFTYSPCAFTNLKGYLGHGKYQYLEGNNYSDTTKLYKAAALYMIKALEKGSAGVKLHAVNGLKLLVSDYIKNIKGKNQDYNIQKLLFAISKGYFDAAADKMDAIEVLKEIWKDDTALFEKLSQQPYNIPTNLKPVVPGKLELAHKYQQDLKSGKKTADQLLIQAIMAEEPEIAAWLLKTGASIDVVDTLLKADADEDETDVKLIRNQKKVCKWLQLKTAVFKPNSESLDAFSLELGYGYKSANLMVLEQKAKQMTELMQTAEVRVPSFLPISNFEIQNALYQTHPEIKELWDQFLKSFDQSIKGDFVDPNKEPSQIPLKISVQGSQILDQIQGIVESYFRNTTYHTLQVAEWLEQEKPEFLIVRSTGKEDSDTNSNAGGNESIPFVKPDAKKISDAMGEVVASYFGSKSINQRLMAGDTTIFTEKPFIPVLLQVMVGENVGGVGSKNEDIPRSGVMFTTQQDKAKGVTCIVAGLGNCHGIVTSEVDVDDYLLDDAHHIHSVIREKETRFVNVEESPGVFKPAPIRNGKAELKKGQALPSPIVHDMKRVADFVSIEYAKENDGSKAMDMEFTVKLKDSNCDKPVIYLLQARPLVELKKVPKSYLRLKGLEDLPVEDIIQAKTLLDGQAHVRQVESNDEVLFVDDLPEALTTYSNHPDQQKIKLIVSRKTAPSTSHEAVTLRPKGVPVLIVSDADKISQVKEMIGNASKDKPVLVDPQRGVIVNTHKTADPHSLIKDGMVSYPIPLELTVPKRGVAAQVAKGVAPTKPEVNAELYVMNEYCDELIKKLCNEQPLFPLKGKDSYTIRGLLDEMATGEKTEAKRALVTLLTVLRASLVKNMKEAEGFRKNSNTPMYEAFFEILRIARKEVAPALDKHQPESLERLYPIKFIDALIFQTSGDVINGYSFAKVLQAGKAERKLAEDLKKEGIDLSGKDALNKLFTHSITGDAYNSEIANHWSLFTKELNQASKSKPQLMAHLMTLIKEVEALGIKGPWLNIIFMETWKSTGAGFFGSSKAENTLANLEAGLKSDAKTLKWISQNRKQLKMNRKQISQFANPAFVKKMTQKLRNQFINEYGFKKEGGNGSLEKQFKHSGKLGRLAILEFVHEAVEVYDETIKAAKGSCEYADEAEKVKDFGTLLECYFEMMQSVMSMLPSDDQKKIINPSKGNSINLATFISKLTNGTKFNYGFGNQFTSEGFPSLVSQAKSGKGTATQLEANADFDVNRVMFGVKADGNFSIRWPSKLEEYFTTFHQNMDKVKKYLSTKEGLNESLLSGDGKTLGEQIKKQFGQQMSHMAIEDHVCEAEYHIPLRQHSGVVSLHYDVTDMSKGVDLKIQLFGNDEHKRWDQATTFGAALGHFKPFSMTESTPPTINWSKPEGTVFSLHIPEGYNQLPLFVTNLRYMMKNMTMGSIGGTKALKTQIESRIPNFNWDNVGEGFYSNALYLNNTLMSVFDKQGKTTLAARAAIGSLIGLARCGMQDYSRGGNIEISGGYLNHPNYSYVTGNTGGKKTSLGLGATLHLIKAMNKDPSIVAEVKALVADDDLKKKLPNPIKALETALLSMKTPTEQFDSYWASNQFADAMIIAQKGQLKTQLDQNMDSSIKQNREAWFQALLKLKINGEEQLYQQIYAKMSPLSANETAALKKFDEVSARKKYLNDLSQNVANISSRMNQFATHWDIILQSSADALIGLSQHESFVGYSPCGFTGLKGYLGGDKYSYIYDNLYSDTTKVRKAIPCYLIKGLESKKEAVQAKAIMMMLKLIEDYRLAGHKGGNAEHYKSAVFAVCRGFWSASINKSAAEKSLRDAWGNDQEFLKQLQAAPYNIPVA